MDKEPPKAGCCIECGKRSRLLLCPECDPGRLPMYHEAHYRGGDRRWNGDPLVRVPLDDHRARP